MGKEKGLGTRQEVGKLVETNFIKDIRFQTLVANSVLGRKCNGKWRMCVDFKACPNNTYTLPRSDQLVDTTCRHALLSFIDAYLSYNKIHMAEGDSQHTTFCTNNDIYHCTIMHFGLINAGTIYKR